MNILLTGVAGFIAKPYEPQLLIDHLHEVIER